MVTKVVGSLDRYIQNVQDNMILIPDLKVLAYLVASVVSPTVT